MTDDIKICSGCSLDKPLAMFMRNRGMLSGYEKLCKTCRATRRQVFIAGQKANIAQMRSKWMDAFPLHIALKHSGIGNITEDAAVVGPLVYVFQQLGPRASQGGDTGVKLK